uniref:PKD domain-containing protein n=1 Tax=candidate division WOR-3 bacterium TaxID=2052148 RepID=A0A7C4TDE7_UNCW3
MRKIILLLALAILIAFYCAEEKNQPPDLPIILSNTNFGYEDSTYTFSALANDPNQDNVSIRFSWGDGDTSNWSPYVASGDTISINHIYSDTGRYTISAQAKDGDDALSNWTIGQSIRILLFGENNYPEPPENPSGPSSGKVDIVYIFSTSAFDPDSDSVAIRFSWGDGDTSSWSSYLPSNQNVSAGHSWNISGNYLIRAQAMDKDSAFSPWSGIHTITIVSNYPPAKPSPPFGPSYGWVDSFYTFSSSTTDPDGDSITLRFSWGDGDTSSWSDYVPSGDTVFISHYWRNIGIYIVRAQARDKKGLTSQWSDGTEIEISSPGNNPPNKPLKPQGPDFGYEDSIYTFFSSTTDPDGDSVALRFSWGDGDTSNWSFYVPGGTMVEMSHSWSLFGTYLIRAQAKDRKGAESEWSDSLEIWIQ